MTARNQQADEGELRSRLAAVDEVAKYMRLKVIHLNQRLPKGLSETFGEANSHHQTSHQSRAASEGHSVNLFF